MQTVSGIVTQGDTIMRAADDVWTWLGMVSTAVVFVLGSMIKSWWQRRHSPDTIPVAGGRVDTRHADARTVEMLQSITRLYDARLAELSEVNHGLLRQLRAVKPALRTVTTWIDAGAEPPPPDVPQDARQALEIDTGAF